MNAKLSMKKLWLGAKKCFTMHIGKNHEEYKNVQLFIDGWSVDTVDNYDTGEKEYEDILERDMKEISHTNDERYLGQLISSDSKNVQNITKLRNKGIVLKNKVIQILATMP